MRPMIRTLAIAMFATVLSAGPAAAVGTAPVKAPQSAADQRYAEAVDLIEQQRYDIAVGLLRTVTREDPDNADAWNSLGFASRKVGDFATSESAYNTALTLDPDHKGALEYQGELRLEQDNLPAAEANLARLRQLCPAGCEELDDLERAVQLYKSTAANPAIARPAGFY